MKSEAARITKMDWSIVVMKRFYSFKKSYVYLQDASYQ